MYSLNQVKRAINHPKLVGQELNRLFYTKFYQELYNTSGVDIMSEDWDALLILDACRYDMFAELSDLPGTLSKRESKGSGTIEFLEANFEGRNLHDTVYITGNPQLYRNEIQVEFHAVRHVWRDEGWDDEYGTVLPDTMIEAAVDASNEFPQKRLIVHLMQPHYPFLTSETEFDKGMLEGEGIGEGDFWQQRFRGELEISANEVWNRYRENLKRVLPAVKTLLDELQGKIVVTSDHGNMVGDRARPIPIREWGHPLRIHTPKLIEVPWLEYINRPRPKIVSDQANQTNDSEVDENVVAERLRDLGYAE